MTNLDSILKSRDITLPTNVHLVSSVQFSRSVLSDSLQPHEPQHTRPPCPSPTPRVHQTHVHQVGDAIQPSHPLSSPSPPAFNLSQHQDLLNESALHIKWPKYWSFSFNISPSMNTQDWSPLGWTGWISLQSKGFSRVFNTTVQKHQFFNAQLSSQSNSHPYVTTRKTIALTRRTFVGKVMSLLFNMLSRLVITFLPRSKCLLIPPNAT